MSEQHEPEPDALPVEKTGRPAAEEEPSLLSSPAIRAIIAVVALVIVVAAVGFIVLTLVSNARRQPMEIDIYPGAERYGQMEVAPGQDRMLYTTPDDAEKVITFYAQRYSEGKVQEEGQQGAEDQEWACVRVENAALVEDPTLPAFEVRCVVDNSIINAHQSATITIQPHTSGEYAGLTVIFIERFWQE